MIQDEVLFTLQLATVVVDLHRRIGDSIAELCKVSYLEFCLLSSVRSHGGAMLLADFSRNALASENTVVVAANALSRAGLVNKGRCASDGRLIVLEENVAGARTLTRGYEGIYRNLRSSVWANHTNEDIEEIMSSFPSVAEKLGVDTVEINRSCHSVLTPAYLMIVAALLRRWAQVVVQYAGLSFVEYRCLAVLETRPSPLPCSVIAEILMLERTTVSTLVAKLARKGLVSYVVRFDHRGHGQAGSRHGRAVCRRGCFAQIQNERIAYAHVRNVLPRIVSVLFSLIKLLSPILLTLNRMMRRIMRKTLYQNGYTS